MYWEARSILTPNVRDWYYWKVIFNISSNCVWKVVNRMDYLKLLFTLYGWFFKFGFSQFQIKSCNNIIMYVVYVRIYAMVVWQFDYIYVPLKYTYIIYTICNSHFTETKSLNLLQPISLKVRTQQSARNHTVSMNTIVIKCGDKLSPLNIQFHGAVTCRKGLLCAPASREGNPHTALPEDPLPYNSL